MANGPGGFLDFAESIVGGLERVTDKMSTPKSAKTTSVPSSPVKPAPPVIPSTSTALVSASRFQIIEAIEDGGDVFVVTDGVSRAVCSSRAFAERVRAGLAEQRERR